MWIWIRKQGSRGAGENAEALFQEKTESILKCIEYSHSNLSAEAQALLLCLAPFTGVININWLEQYTGQLKAQPALAELPYDRWQEVIQEAVNWGLMQPHEQLGQMGYLRLQPIFPYFLKSRLNDEKQAAQKQAIEKAFREHYDDIGGFLGQLIGSKEAQERQLGQVLIGVEYENLVMATELAILSQAQFYNAYEALFRYLRSQQNHQAAVDLSKKVLSSQINYREDQIQGDIGRQFYLVFARLAASHLELKNHPEAEEAYKNSLEIVENLKAVTRETRANYQAGTLHQLGRVAQAQRQWPAAEQYFKEALQIFIDFNDRFSQAGTLHQLGSVAQEQRQWPAAEQYYKEALQIYIDFNDRYEQASTLHQLGRVAEDQEQWDQAVDYALQSASIFSAYNDPQLGIALRSLARIRQASGQADIAGKLAAALGVSEKEAAALLEEKE